MDRTSKRGKGRGRAGVSKRGGASTSRGRGASTNEGGSSEVGDSTCVGPVGPGGGDASTSGRVASTSVGSASTSGGAARTSEGVPSTSGRSGNSTAKSIYETNYAIQKRNVAETKKALSKMPLAVRKEYIERKKRKQLERVLLPDAPPPKRSRKRQSPERSAYRLVEGTPVTPPTPKLMTWQMKKSMQSLPSPSSTLERPSRTSSFDSCVEVPGFEPLLVDWTTGNLVTQSEQTTPPSITRPTSSNSTPQSASKSSAHLLHPSSVQARTAIIQQYYQSKRSAHQRSGY
ncbi:hypothetical protein evm_004966 [Chilo suppressalis]|nr:hypothetical protein evm_004966 [Chilo suppressalis]